MGGHKERWATINRRERTRSRYSRCPCCKKLRLKVPRSNHKLRLSNRDGTTKPRTVGWVKNSGGRLICFICALRTEV